MVADALCSFSAAEMQALLRDKQVSALELIDAHIAQIENLNERINAFTSLHFEQARDAARRLDRDAASGNPTRPLHGLPYCVKDNFDVGGIPTSFGASCFRGNIPEADCRHVANVRSAGAIVIAKTNLPEFALGDQTTNNLTGTTRNPVDPSTTVAGSSGGAAAALAAGMTALADGSDLAGSVRSPAAWTGTVGFRPSNQVFARFPASDVIGNLHTPGPMARTVTDVILLFDAMRGAASKDVHRESKHGTGRPRRIAFSLSPCGIELDREIESVLRVAFDRFSEINCITEEGFPELRGIEDIQRVFLCLNVLRTLPPAAIERERELGPKVRAILQQGRTCTARQITTAKQLNSGNRDAIRQFFGKHDFIVCPTTAGQAFSSELAESEIDEDWLPVFFSPALSLPTISIPAGNLENGMPVGLQIAGPPDHDVEVLELARDFEILAGEGAIRASSV